jgi:uncharacterized membrane protein (UPF0136 family)
VDQKYPKSIARRLVIELTAVVLLVAVDSHFPKAKSYAQSWWFVLTHPPLLLHVIVGTIVLAEASILLLRSLRSPNRSWIILASTGLAFVLLAFVSGERYVATQRPAAIVFMDLGWLGALVTYSLGWSLGRKGTPASPIEA